MVLLRNITDKNLLEEYKQMGVFEVISAVILILACVFIVVVVLMKDTKTQMSQTISGSSSDSFYQKNVGRTKEAMLNKATIVAAIVFFVLALAVNVINVYFGNKSSNNTSSTSSTTSSVVTSSDTSSDTESSDTSSDSTSSKDESSTVSDTSGENTDSSVSSVDER